MTLQNIQGSQEVLRSQEFFRIKQDLQSSGDIFEVDVGTRAIYLGPDSDIAEVKATYFNPNEPGALQTTTISPGAPFVNRLDANNATLVPSTGTPGKIFLTPVDIIDNILPTLNPGTPRLLVKPRIDVIAALTSGLPSLPQARSDLSLRFPVNYTSLLEIIIPAYNRRLVSISIGTPAFTSLDYIVSALTLTPSSFLNFKTLASGVQPPTNPSQVTISEVFTASTVGTFDLLRIRFGPGAFPGAYSADLTIRLSDRE